MSEQPPQVRTKEQAEKVAKILGVDIVGSLAWLDWSLFKKGDRRQSAMLGYRSRSQEGAINKYLTQNWNDSTALSSDKKTKIIAICEEEKR